MKKAVADAQADALCTSTNPRLTLVMGTGASVRSAGGFDILRQCEAIIAEEGLLPPGAVRATTAGTLPWARGLLSRWRGSKPAGGEGGVGQRWRGATAPIPRAGGW